MEIEEKLKNLSYEKKMGIARFSLEVAAADGEITDEESTIIAKLAIGYLGLSEKDIDRVLETDYSNVLKDFDIEEAGLMGLLLGIIAKADGVVSMSELKHIKKLLDKVGFGPDLAAIVINALGE